MWPDKETNIDYLNFRYLVDLIVEIAMNRELTPSTIGLYGGWVRHEKQTKKSSRNDRREILNWNFDESDAEIEEIDLCFAHIENIKRQSLIQ